MDEQMTIPFTGAELRDAGMKQAIDHADQVNEGWSEKAYSHLVAFVNSKKMEERFMMEDVRSCGDVPEPPSFKAWGSVARRAILNNVIRKVGVSNVINPRAHRAYAAVYVKR